LDPAAFIDVLAATLDAADVACFQLYLCDADDETYSAVARALAPVCQERDVAFLLNARHHLVAATGADGVHVQGPVKGLRRKLPEGAILGAGCGHSRHEAMEAGEAGADYVSFGPWGPEAAEALTWWQLMMELPCVAAGGLDLDNAAAAKVAGADFVLLRSAVWNAPEGAPAAAARAAASIA
jgi:thiamine-phosphate pyrophosphorylase